MKEFLDDVNWKIVGGFLLEGAATFFQMLILLIGMIFLLTLFFDGIKLLLN